MAQLNVGGNFLAGLSGGLQAGQGIQQMRDGNALRAIGPGLMSGDPNALNKLASIDPMAAMDLQRTRQADQRAEQQSQQTSQLNSARLEQIKADSARAVAEDARRMTAEQKAAEAAKIDGALASASAAYQQGPEAFTAWTQQNAAAIQESGLDPAQVTHEAFPMIAAGLVGAREGLTAGAGFAQGLRGVGGDTEADRELGRMQSIGIPRDIAIKIKEGVFKTVTDPETREAVVIDLASGQPVYRVNMNGQQQTPSQPDTPQPELSFGSRFDGAGDAFGVGGALRKGVNAVGDTVGLGQAFPEAASAQSDFRVMREGLTSTMSDAYAGRVPAFLLQNIQNLTPDAGRVFEGPDAAQDKLRALGRSFQQEQERLSQRLSQRLSPADRAAVRDQLQAVESGLNQVSEALEGFQSGTAIPEEDREFLRSLGLEVD